MGSAFKQLVSDSVFCQANGTARISFRIWATKGVQLSICAMSLEMKELECQRISLMRSPAPSLHRFDLTSAFLVGIFLRGLFSFI